MEYICGLTSIIEYAYTCNKVGIGFAEINIGISVICVRYIDNKPVIAYEYRVVFIIIGKIFGIEELDYGITRSRDFKAVCCCRKFCRRCVSTRAVANALALASV